MVLDHVSRQSREVPRSTALIPTWLWLNRNHPSSKSLLLDSCCPSEPLVFVPPCATVNREDSDAHRSDSLFASILSRYISSLWREHSRSDVGGVAVSFFVSFSSQQSL